MTALAMVDYDALSTVVVDNGSTDDSVNKIRERFPGIKIVETGRNLGFAGGVNAGIREALKDGADFVWVLNNDTVPQPGSLIALLRTALSYERIGAVGSVLVYPDGQVQAWGGGRVNRWIGVCRHATSAHIDSWFDYLTAASLLLPRRALEEVGLFDESFFLYWEDTDLSFRLKRRGWLLAVAADSIVVHRAHASTGRDQRKIDRFSTRTGIRFLLKHSPLPRLSVPLFIVLRLGKRLLAGNIRQIRDITGGVVDYLSEKSASGQ
jgi:GT2 family glycosyltransferase